MSIPSVNYCSSLEQSIAALLNLNTSVKRRYSALEISNHLRSDYGLNIHWRTIDAQFDSHKDLVARRKREGRWEYDLLSAGRALVEVTARDISFVDPVNALQSTKQLMEIFGSLCGVVRICDPYLDEVTMEQLEALPKAIEVRVLTSNIRDTGRLRRLLAAATIAGYQFQIRRAVSNILHDRYIIDENQMLILGTSLNGFGKKHSFVINAGADIRATMLAQFNTLWVAGTFWP